MAYNAGVFNEDDAAANNQAARENAATTRAEGIAKVAQANRQSQEDIAAQRSGAVTGTGVLTKYHPAAGRPSGPQPQGIAPGAGDLSEAALSYNGGAGAEAPIGVIRGMRVSYAARGTGPGGEVEGGALPEYATRGAAMQAENQMTAQKEKGDVLGMVARGEISKESGDVLTQDVDQRLGTYVPPGTTIEEQKHLNRMEENAGKPLSKAQEDEKKRQAGLLADDFTNGLQKNPIFFQLPGVGQKGQPVERDPRLLPMMNQYAARIANGTMTPQQANEAFEKEAVGTLYHQYGATEGLRTKTAPTLKKNFESLYGTPINPQAGASLLTGNPSHDQKLFLLQTIHGVHNIPLAQKLGLLPSEKAVGNVPGAMGGTTTATVTQAPVSNAANAASDVFGAGGPRQMTPAEEAQWQADQAEKRRLNEVAQKQAMINAAGVAP